VATTLACRNGTGWSAYLQAAVDNYILADYVVIAVHREPQSLAWHRWHRQMSRKCMYQPIDNIQVTIINN